MVVVVILLVVVLSSSSSSSSIHDRRFRSFGNGVPLLTFRDWKGFRGGGLEANVRFRNWAKSPGATNEI